MGVNPFIRLAEVMQKKRIMPTACSRCKTPFLARWEAEKQQYARTCPKCLQSKTDYRQRKRLTPEQRREKKARAAAKAARIRAEMLADPAVQKVIAEHEGQREVKPSELPPSKFGTAKVQYLCRTARRDREARQDTWGL